ncbi:MAG: primosomal protein N' [Phycisphaerales bacterium]|jgi:primosomal protein N' (replication factor Y)
MRDSSLFSSQTEATTGVFARVAVARGIDRLDGDGSLTYSCTEPAPHVGELVNVPLGKGKASGIVIEVGGAELLGDVEAWKVKPMGPRSGAALPGALIELARWMAGYYVCPLGMVLANMLPAAVKHGTGAKRVEMVRRVASITPGTGGSPEDGEHQVVTPELSPRSSGSSTPASPGASPGLSSGDRPHPPETKEPKLSPTAKRAWLAIAAMAEADLPVPLQELVLRAGVKSAGPIRALVKLGLLTITTESTVRAGDVLGLAALGAPLEGELSPTAAQRAAIEGIWAARENFGVHLLHGVTGSGKTEVYLQLIARVLAAGRTALVLVPEIALTPQTSVRFTKRFGREHVAVLHSGLTASQRHKEWARAAGGGARVVVGARSAVFAPLRDLGLIVVDEEHDGSYKQDRLPRYNARDVAIKRGQHAACPVVLGSATPSLESWANAKAGPARRYTLWSLASRAGGANMPTVRIVNLVDERRLRREAGHDDGRFHLLGPTLEAALERTLGEGGQAILLLNRRGLASQVWCRRPNCGYVLRCDQCDANLIIHKLPETDRMLVMRCHHCLSEQRVPRLCPTCGDKLAHFGGGTQRAEEELGRKFAAMGLVDGTTLRRIDADTMRTGRDYFAALEAFSRGEVRVLLGTQMIAKGLDFPNVRLVGVVDADTALNLPDFRSSERTFQLVSQVAGRAGRGAHAGEVVIQTLSPDAPAIRLAAAHDYVTFADEELADRVKFGLPPATRMARVVCRDERSDKASAAATELAKAIQQAGGVRVRGPLPCTVSRIAGQFRFAVDVLGERAGDVQAALSAVRRVGLLVSDAKTAVDVDPVSLM